MSLDKQLARIREGASKRIPPEKLAVMHRATEDLRTSGILDGIVRPDDRLPEFALENQNGVVIRSADLLARGPLVLAVFRGSW